MGEGVPTNRDDHGPEQGRRWGPDWAGRLGSVSVDWWATAVAGVIVAPAVADALLKTPW